MRATLSPALLQTALAPTGGCRIGSSPHTKGDGLLQPLALPVSALTATAQALRGEGASAMHVAVVVSGALSVADALRLRGAATGQG